MLFGSMDWEQSPVLLDRNDECLELSKRFGYAEFEALLWLVARLSPESIQISRDSEHLPPDKIRDVDIIRNLPNLVETGHSIAVNYVERFDAQLASFLMKLGEEIRCVAHGSLFFSPPSSGTFRAHYDSIDVVAFQLRGEKTWLVDRQDTDLPLATHTFPVDDIERDWEEFSITTGQALYVPRGKIHHVRTVDDGFSLHLSAGLAFHTHADVWKRHIHIRSEREIGLRRSDTRHRHRRARFTYDTAEIPDIGMSPYAMQIAHDSLHASDLSQLPQLPGRLEALVKRSQAAANSTYVRRAPIAITREYLAEGQIAVGFPGLAAGRFSKSNAFLTFPLKLLPLLEFIQETTVPFTREKLPGICTSDEQDILLERLVREGVLEMQAAHQ